MSIAPTAADSAANPLAAAPTSSNLYREQAVPRTPESSLSFWDLLDVINPLQHIPVIGSIYRALTGDEISAPARVAGGTLYGGVVGFAASVASAIVEDKTGRDPAGHAVALLFGDEVPAPEVVPVTAVAEAPTPDSAPDSAAEPEPRPEPAATATGVPAPGMRFLDAPARTGTATGRFYALPPREVASAPAPGRAAEARVPEPSAGAKQPAVAEWPPGGPAPLPPNLVADAMMAALDKYQSTARLGTSGGKTPAE